MYYTLRNHSTNLSFSYRKIFSLSHMCKLQYQDYFRTIPSDLSSRPLLLRLSGICEFQTHNKEMGKNT